MRTNTRKHSVISSNLQFVGYSRKHEILDITFKSGETYRYFNVPRKIYDRLMRAESKGKFYNAFIRSQPVYAPVKLKNDNPLPKPPFKATDAPLFMAKNTYMVIGENGEVVRISSNYNWATKDTIDWANRNPGVTYYAVAVLGEAVVSHAAKFRERNA